MRRIIFFIAVCYLAGLGLLDAVAYHGRYTRAAWHQVNYQVNRAYFEVQVVLDRIGVGTSASAGP